MADDCLTSKCSPRRDPVEFCHCLSMVSITIGVALVAMGYLIPRDYVFDPELPASEMEAIEDYYNRKSAALDVCIVVGTVFVGLGGLIITGIFMMMFIQGDFKECLGDNEDDVAKCLSAEKSEYGSVPHGGVMTPKSQEFCVSHEDVMNGRPERTRFGDGY